MRVQIQVTSPALTAGVCPWCSCGDFAIAFELSLLVDHLIDGHGIDAEAIWLVDGESGPLEV